MSGGILVPCSLIFSVVHWHHFCYPTYRSFINNEILEDGKVNINKDNLHSLITGHSGSGYDRLDHPPVLLS